MANILPRDLEPAALVTESAAIIIDNGVSVEKSTPQQIVDAGRPNATEAEAIAGADNAKGMTPLRVKQAVLAQSALVPANGVASTLAALKAAPTTNVTMIYDKATFTWTLGNFTGLNDDINIVKADSTAISVGAWVRLGSTSLTFAQTGTGAVMRTVFDKLGETLSVKDFGATGAGSPTNDAAAIQAAFDAAEAAGGREVVFPRGTYFTGSTTINCGVLSSIRAVAGAEIHYTGSGDALVIRGVSVADTYSRDFFLPLIRRNNTIDWNLGTDTTSVAVRIIDCKYCNFFMQGIKRFNRGLVHQTIAANVVCNKFYLGIIQNCRISIDFSEVTGGWGANQNTYFGGSCIIDTIYITTPNRIYINMPNAENNTNTFVGVNLEKGGNEKAVVCGSTSNIFLNCRFEGSASTAGYLTFTGNNNRVIGGAPASSATPPYATWVSDTGVGNVYWTANVLASKYMSIDFQAQLGILLGIGTAYPATPIGAYGVDGVQYGKSGTVQHRFHGVTLQQGATVTSGTTLPLRNSLTLTYASATTITGTTGGAYSDATTLFAVMSTNGNATLQHTASPTTGFGKFVLKAGVDLLLTANVPVLFMLSGGNFYQT